MTDRLRGWKMSFGATILPAFYIVSNEEDKVEIPGEG